MRSSTIPLVVSATLGLLAASSASTDSKAAEKYAATELKEPAPESLTAEIRNLLGKAGYRVSDASGKAICDVWLRRELPLLDKFQEQNELKYPIEPGTLFGAIRLPSASSDYRKQAIKAGTYTLRFGHQPQDGNHIGTAKFRDFVVACPVADDKSGANLDPEKAMELSKKAANSTHPAIFSLLPPQSGRDKFPSMAHDDELNLEMLVIKTNAKKGAATKDIQIELVTVGHAAE